nr:MAG TPA: hypothetical protein [Caudoviricetes sp.]
MAKKNAETPREIYDTMWLRLTRLHMQGPSGDAKEDKRMCECMGWPDLAQRLWRGEE